MIPPSVDFDLLRVFVAICRLGGVSRAALSLSRTQSGLSMQVQRLESLFGRKLFVRHGRGLRPTVEGEVLLGYALRMIDLGAEAYEQVRRVRPETTLRIGVPQEVAANQLPAALRMLQVTHPATRLSVSVDTTVALGDVLRAGGLDVMVGALGAAPVDPHLEWTTELEWVCGAGYSPHDGDTLDVVTFDEPCLWRSRMMRELEGLSRPWRVAFSSRSLTAVQAAVEMGSGVALLDASSVRPVGMKRFPFADAGGTARAVKMPYGVFVAGEPTPVVDALLAGFKGAVAGPRGLHPDRDADHLATKARDPFN